MLSSHRWGISAPGASIGFERDVRVDVQEDRLVLAERHTVPIGQGESKQETLEQFAVALDASAREWGPPPQGFFWAPKLKFIVRPEGNGNYEQISGMMTRAGISSTHEFTKDSSSVVFGRDETSEPKPVLKPVPKSAATSTGRRIR